MLSFSSFSVLLYFPMPAEASRDTSVPLIWADLSPSLSSTIFTSFFTLLTKTAAPISALALAWVLFTLKPRLSSFSLEAVMRESADTLTELSTASDTLVAVITAFFPMVMLASFLLETTPTAAPRPKAEFFFALSPPSLVPSNLSLTSLTPPLPSVPAASLVFASLVSTLASLSTLLGSMDFFSLFFSSWDFSESGLFFSALAASSS